MTKYRVHGSDTPFCAWMRRQPTLPSFGSQVGFVADDADLYIHRYLSEVDGIGTREIQGIMLLETKTRGGRPDRSQQDTLFTIHRTIITDKAVEKRPGQWVRNFGVSVLSMSQTSPADSERMWWGRFNSASEIAWQSIAVEDLLRLLRFELHPDTLAPRPFRRHHKNHAEIVEHEMAPLGFAVERRVQRRS